QPPGFEVVPEWRWQQEQALRAADPGARGMDRDALLRFVQHYERVSRQALRVLPARADVVVELDRARRPVALRLRGDGGAACALGELVADVLAAPGFGHLALRVQARRMLPAAGGAEREGGAVGDFIVRHLQAGAAVVAAALVHPVAVRAGALDPF